MIEIELFDPEMVKRIAVIGLIVLIVTGLIIYWNNTK